MLQVDGRELTSLIGWLDYLTVRDVPFAASLALNKTAQRVKADLRGEMERIFDRPTAFTLNALQMKPSTKTDLKAEIGLKTSPDWGQHYLRPQVYGGARRHTRFEGALRHAGILPADKWAVPAKGFPLDSAGNLSRGIRMQILSALGAQRDVYANRSERSRKRRMAMAKKPPDWFIVSRNGKAEGIGRKQRDSLRLAIAFVSKPHYKPIFRFHEIGQRSADANISRSLSDAIEYVLRTSK